MSDKETGERGGPFLGPFADLLSRTLGKTPTSDAMREWERLLSAQMERFFRSDLFLSQMGRVLESNFGLKAQLDRMVDQSLRAMRLPAVGDVDAVYRRLDELERRLDAMSEQLQRLTVVETRESGETDAPEEPEG